MGLSSESGRLLAVCILPGELDPFWMRSGGTCCRAISTGEATSTEARKLTDCEAMSMARTMALSCSRCQARAQTIQSVNVARPGR